MSLNQGQLRTVSLIRNLLSPPTHKRTQFLPLTIPPIKKSDGRHIKLKCLLKREMNPSFWMKTLFYSDSMKDLHHTVNGSRQQSHSMLGWFWMTQKNSLCLSSQYVIHCVHAASTITREKLYLLIPLY